MSGYKRGTVGRPIHQDDGGRVEPVTSVETGNITANQATFDTFSTTNLNADTATLTTLNADNGAITSLATDTVSASTAALTSVTSDTVTATDATLGAVAADTVSATTSISTNALTTQSMLTSSILCTTGNITLLAGDLVVGGGEVRSSVPLNFSNTIPSYTAASFASPVTVNVRRARINCPTLADLTSAVLTVNNSEVINVATGPITLSVMSTKKVSAHLRSIAAGSFQVSIYNEGGGDATDLKLDFMFG